jgi:hypothetical protein
LSIQEKEDFIGMKTTQNQKKKKKIGLYFRVRVNVAFDKKRFFQK